MLTFHLKYGRADFPRKAPASVGWKQASTFPGFCAHHDSATFAALESGSFEGTPEQCFLLAYRSVCHELSSKRTALLQQDQAREIFSQMGTQETRAQVEEIVSTQKRFLRAGVRELEREKSLMDAALLASNFHEYEAGILSFTGPACVVSAGSFAPEFDVDGTRVQRIVDDGAPLHSMHTAVDFANEEPRLVFVWHRSAVPCRKYADALFAKPSSELERLAPHLLFLYLENTFFSERWWEECSADVKNEVRRLTFTIVPTSESAKELSTTPLTPWRLAGKRRSQLPHGI